MYELTLKVKPREDGTLDPDLWNAEAIAVALDPTHAYDVEVLWASAGKSDRQYPHDYETSELCPIHTSLATLEILTVSQRNRIKTLIDGYRADHAMVWRDGFNISNRAQTNVGFCLYKGRESNLANVIVNGMIEADGRSHT